MGANLFKKMAVHAALYASIIVVSSCVNEKYEISKDSLDLNVTVFQEGLALPLGSTGKLRLGSLVDQLGFSEDLKQFFTVGEDGSYAMRYKSDAPFDMSGNLDFLTEALSLNKIDYTQSVAFSLGSVGAASFGFEGMKFRAEENIADKFPTIDLNVPQIKEQFELKADLYAGASDMSELDLTKDLGGASHSYDFTLATLDSGLIIPDVLFENQTAANKALSISEVSSMLRKNISIKENIEKSSFNTRFQHVFPKEVKSVSKLHLAKGAKLKVSVKILNPFFNGGSIIPHLDLDLSELFHLANNGGTVHDDHIDSDFVLSAANGWMAEGEYEVTEIVLDEDNDWDYTQDAEGNKLLCLDKSVSIKVSGKLRDGGLTTSLAFLDSWLDSHPQNRDVGVAVELSFENLAVDDATFELNPVKVETIQSFAIEIPQMSLPKEVASVEDIVFSNNSNIELVLDANDLFKLGDVSIDVESMSVTFPEMMKVEGADADNTVDLAGSFDSNGIFTKKIKLKGLELNDPDKDGNIAAVEELVKVDVVLATSGKFHTADLPETSGQGITLKGEVEAEIEVSDYSVRMAGFKVDSQSYPELFSGKEIKIEIPEEMGDVQGLAVRFDNDPAISISIEMPQIQAGLGPLGANGLAIKFPDMLKFKTDGPYAYLNWFDPVRNALVFGEGKNLPGSISLPIDCLIVNPVKDQEDGKYYASGSVQVLGALGLSADSILTKEDIDALSRPGTKVSFEAVVPALEVDEVSMDAYSATIEKSVEFEPFKSVSLPDMLTYIGSIGMDDTYLTISMKAGEGFPDLGAGSVLSLGLDITLPEFIKLDDPRFENGKLSVLGVMEKKSSGKMEMTVEPVKISAIEINKSKKEVEQIKGNIAITGRVNLSGASLDINEWLGGKTHKLDISVGIATVKDGQHKNIEIKSITGKLDYKIDPMEMVVDLSFLSDVLNGDNMLAKIDLPDFYVALNLNSNLGIPLAADVAIIPYYGKETGEPVQSSIRISGAASSEEQKKTVIWLSGEAPAPGVCDCFVDVNLRSLLYKDESYTTLVDSLKLKLSAGIDSEKMCIYEPAAEYNLSIDYAAGFPLSFGKDFEFAYRDTLTDLSDDLGKIIAYSNGLGLGGEVENSFPFAVTLKIDLCDSKGKRIGGTPTNGPLIKSANASGQPVKTKLDLFIDMDKDAPYDDISAIHIEFKVDTKSAPDVALNENSFIRINSLYARIPKGVTIDLSGLASEKKVEGGNN